MKWRFLLFVFLAALVPLAPALLVTGEAAWRAEGDLEDRITAATQGLSARLEADGARRREILLRLTALPVLSAAVEEAAGAHQAPSAENAAAVRNALSELFPREVPELVAVVTSEGAQVVVTRGEPKAVDAKSLPFAAAALGGQFADGVGQFDGATYRFSAAPVGIADGAIVLGERLGDTTAMRLRDVVRADVTFVAGTTVVASSLPVDQRAEVAEAVSRSGNVYRSGSLPIGIPALESLRGTFPVFVRTELARSLSKDAGGGVAGIVTITADRELGWLARLQLLSLALTLGLFLIGLLWISVIYGPVKRQVRSLEAHAARLRADRNNRLGTKGFTVPFLGLAQELDRLAEEWAKADAGEFRERAPRTTLPPPPREEKTPPPYRPSQELRPAPEPQRDEPEGTPSAFPFGDDLRAKARALGLDESVDPPAKPAEKPAPKSAPPKAEPRPEVALLGATGTDDGPIPLPSTVKKPDPFAQFGPTPTPDDDDRTREAAIPAELLARSRELEAELLEAPEDPDEEHFKAVYNEFVATKKQCGEPPDGLTFDKFVARLKKNREQLVSKYACRTVRFQVYVKDGKAAIKASPVR